MACVFRSRPCLAEPPAESPSTMNSSLLPGSVEAQSASLPGRLRRWETAVLRETAWAAARRLVLEQETFEGGPQGAVDLRLRFGAAETLLGLPLKLGLLHVDRQHAHDPFADVLRGQRDALGGQVGVVDECAHRFDDGGPEALLVRPPLGGGDAVHVGPDRLFVGLGPLQGGLDAKAAVAATLRRREVEGLRRGGRLPAIGHDLGQKVGDAAGVGKRLFRPGRLVDEDDLQPLVQEGLGVEAEADGLG
jgi:hypothetical protein